MKNHVNISISILVLFVAVCFSVMSCEQIQHVLYDMPYSIEEVYIQSSNESDNNEASKNVGTTVHVKIRNLNVNDVDSINLSFRIYRKSDGKNPLLGDNEIRSQFEGTLKSGCSADYLIDISNKVSLISSTNLVLDHIYVSKIQFHDGSVWTDLIGLYATGGKTDE